MNQNQERPNFFILTEELRRTQNYNTSFERCRNILKEIEEILNERVISYFSSFKSPSGIIDKDASIIEDLLRCKSDKPGLFMILNSPGGQAIAAEKIITVCRAYSEATKTNWHTFVPKSAKSAATMIALGSDKIFLSKTAELGAIDPQIVISLYLEKGHQIQKERRIQNNQETETEREEKIFGYSPPNVIPAFRIIKAVEELLKESRRLLNFSRMAYNQFLGQYSYDHYLMSKNELRLSEDILNRIIKKKGFSKDIFRIFLDPEMTLSHNRPITLSDLIESPLRKNGFIEDFIDFYKQKLPEDTVLKLDSLLWEYYIRTNTHLEDTGNPVSKTIETSTHRFHLTPDEHYFIS